MNFLLVSEIKLYIQAFTWSFEAAYDSKHHNTKEICIFYYGSEFSSSPNEVVPFQSVVFSVDRTPEETDAVVRSVHFPGDGTFAIQVFHETMDNKIQKLRYQSLGYRYYLPNILQEIRLPTEYQAPNLEVEQVDDPTQVDHINATFSDFKPFPEKLIHAKGCSSFAAIIDGKTAGWGYLVFSNPETAYIGGMFTAPAYRQRGVASALLDQMHRYAYLQGIKKILLVPSFMAWNFYTRRGYQTIAHFSTFLPSRDGKSTRN